MAVERRSQLACSFSRYFRPAREGIKLRATIVLRVAPFRTDPALLFQAMKRWIERALADLKCIFRNELDALRDAPAVHGFERDSFENEKIERALNEVGRFAHVAPLS